MWCGADLTVAHDAVYVYDDGSDELRTHYDVIYTKDHDNPTEVNVT